ncbi:binding-protein-dependent transport systems inner membrane component [Beutenbergia cavernae DSM 12333]|uniref:Binding-protein-dependent transport systems inner membrane component n=1 Tax=Beutenbergia cavernae (strain ATCC BAA-8 / DSM 12333 / CCUG 43141 / JCM 11478 / NBRC 16432 / NCIMB 13614 / HKI 0122) TaxID=471853 RepID=C5BYV5_BEUC1|nr:carbohydrate ABC transporter permease [Beutenbergia cavernae]ACQ79063.1 binding-protein-dependent transport systems inner membrane component [Beutenbergia cavernae DSM 12333]
MSAEIADAPPARSTRTQRVVLQVVLAVLALAMIYPLLWMFMSSLRENDSIFSDASLALRNLTFDNYVRGWDAQQFPFSRYFVNSIVVTTAVILANVVACSLTAFAFARMSFRMKPVLMAVMLMTIMLPEHVTIVPQYVLFSELGWLNTFLPLTIPKLFATEAFFVFLIIQFMRGIPQEIDEAAAIDGCGPFATYRRIMLPLITPALATTAIFSFIWTWNDFFRPLIFLTDNSLFTVPLAVRLFVDIGGTDWGALFAMSILSLVPIFLFFVFGQRYLIRGIATTGLK